MEINQLKTINAEQARELIQKNRIIQEQNNEIERLKRKEK